MYYKYASPVPHCRDGFPVAFLVSEQNPESDLAGMHGIAYPDTEPRAQLEAGLTVTIVAKDIEGIVQDPAKLAARQYKRDVSD